jgi:hypothetical protein
VLEVYLCLGESKTLGLCGSKGRFEPIRNEALTHFSVARSRRIKFWMNLGLILAGETYPWENV